MSTKRHLVFILLMLGGLIWSGVVFSVQYLQLSHVDMITKIRAGDDSISEFELKLAIQNYEDAAPQFLCQAEFYRNLALLYSYGADMAIISGEYTQSADDYLAKAMNALTSLVTCAPTDGKAWLDLAVLHLHREGVGENMLNAFVRSGKVSPRESWLAEKRLIMALQMQNVLTDAAREVTLRDIATLNHAHPNRLARVMQEANVQTESSLKFLLAGPTDK